MGVNPDTRAPQLIVEAKAWSKPMVAASDVAAAKEEKSTSYTSVTLIAAAIEHCKAGGAIDASPVTAEWARWIAKLRDYVVGTHAKSGHIVSRVTRSGCERYLRRPRSWQSEGPSSIAQLPVAVARTSILCLLISPSRGRLSKFAFERPAKRFL
jgi:hypothetical protein